MPPVLSKGGAASESDTGAASVWVPSPDTSYEQVERCVIKRDRDKTRRNTVLLRHYPWQFNSTFNVYVSFTAVRTKQIWQMTIIETLITKRKYHKELYTFPKGGQSSGWIKGVGRKMSTYLRSLCCVVSRKDIIGNSNTACLAFHHLFKFRVRFNVLIRFKWKSFLVLLAKTRMDDLFISWLSI